MTDKDWRSFMTPAARLHAKAWYPAHSRGLHVPLEVAMAELERLQVALEIIEKQANHIGPWMAHVAREALGPEDVA